MKKNNKKSFNFEKNLDFYKCTNGTTVIDSIIIFKAKTKKMFIVLEKTPKIIFKGVKNFDFCWPLNLQQDFFRLFSQNKIKNDCNNNKMP